MKKVKYLVLVCFLATSVTSAFAGEPTEADKKWGAAVQNMIADGVSTISTPSETRAALAKDLAVKAGRACQVEKTATGFKVVISPRKLATK